GPDHHRGRCCGGRGHGGGLIPAGLGVHVLPSALPRQHAVTAAVSPVNRVERWRPNPPGTHLPCLARVGRPHQAITHCCASSSVNGTCTNPWSFGVPLPSW